MNNSGQGRSTTEGCGVYHLPQILPDQTVPEQTLPLVELTGVKSCCFLRSVGRAPFVLPPYFPSTLHLVVGSLRTISHLLKAVIHSCLCYSLSPHSTSHLKCWTREHLSRNLHWFLKSARRERAIFLYRSIYKMVMAVRLHTQRNNLLPCCYPVGPDPSVPVKSALLLGAYGTLIRVTRTSKTTFQSHT